MLNWLCAGRIGLGRVYDEISFACHMFMHSPCIRTLFQYTCYIWNVFGTFLIVSFSPYLFYFCPLRPRTLFLLWHHLRLILLLLISGSVMSKPERTSWRTSLDKVFIRNAESFWWTSPTLTYPMSFTVRVGSHCVTSRSLVLPCWFRSLTPTCMDSIFQYLSFILAFEVRALLSHHSLL